MKRSVSEPGLISRLMEGENKRRRISSFVSSVLKKLTQGKFAYIQQIGINATSLKKKRIHFKSDVFKFSLPSPLSMLKLPKTILKTCCPFSGHHHQFPAKGNLPQLFSV